MTLDEAIAHAREVVEEHEQLVEWLEKLKTIENIMLVYNANWYADEDDGVPDCEVLESIWNVIQDNGLDIDIEQDYRKVRAEVIEEFREYLKTIVPCEMPQDIWNIGVDNTCDRMLKEKK